MNSWCRHSSTHVWIDEWCIYYSCVRVMWKQNDSHKTAKTKCLTWKAAKSQCMDSYLQRAVACRVCLHGLSSWLALPMPDRVSLVSVEQQRPHSLWDCFPIFIRELLQATSVVGPWSRRRHSHVIKPYWCLSVRRTEHYVHWACFQPDSFVRFWNKPLFAVSTVLVGSSCLILE